MQYVTRGEVLWKTRAGLGDHGRENVQKGEMVTAFNK